MASEIERKFLVTGPGWRPGPPGECIRQGYLSIDPDRTVRIRVVGHCGFITVKGRTIGVTRSEFEYPVPASDAHEMLDELCHQPIIDKTRHVRVYAGHRWEIDVFHGANEGLVLAEIELESEDEPFERPPWLGPEVSGDPRYYNASLVRKPFSAW